MKKFAIFSLLILLSIAFSCKKPKPDCTDYKNPDCPNYDPCWDVKKADAAFEVFDSMFYFPAFQYLQGRFVTDTFFQNHDIWFRALNDNETYE